MPLQTFVKDYAIEGALLVACLFVAGYALTAGAVIAVVTWEKIERWWNDRGSRR